jgi:aryl-alcohol dehydrogenase-like predicted oxidoreductase
MQLGFGTAALGRSLTKRERVHLLETAYECGIRHFDTAPLYGAGTAEEALGLFLRHAGDEVTVATKVGIRASSTARLVLSRLIGRSARAQGGLFAPDQVRTSLEGSLRRLGTKHVDLVLLHEVEAASVDDALLETLDDAIARGVVGRVGIATNGTETAAILDGATTFPTVVQVAAGDVPSSMGDRRLIVHSVIVGKEGAPGELLRAAAERHPSALLLFGSRKPEHIRETAERFLRPA